MGLKNSIIGLSLICMMVPSFVAIAAAEGSSAQKETKECHLCQVTPRTD
ncbi:hypothetical protein KHA94_21000 [Bacillus sp. FJAT-49705]|uniref:Uncharacterized protein n=1 Tax=Cytobacillus citreus TaxID=2833586 RepID=A0ABS5NXQ6_9BACI|nr:hypothetical protein [Cytobacillus citreus]MBS4192624.1 hypothetical protein [Cytobacillus citreus]